MKHFNKKRKVYIWGEDNLRGIWKRRTSAPRSFGLRWKMAKLPPRSCEIVCLCTIAHGWVKAVTASKHIYVRRRALQCGEFQLCATGQVLVKSIHWIPLRGVSVCVGYRRGGTGGVIRWVGSWGLPRKPTWPPDQPPLILQSCQQPSSRHPFLHHWEGNVLIEIPTSIIFKSTTNWSTRLLRMTIFVED